MAEDLKVSVVVPCYNAQAWIVRAIKSVQAQRGIDLDLIVIDDGSTDDSLKIIKDIEPAVRWKAVTNRGACVARNYGASLAKHPFIMFLDADDYLESGTLMHLADAMERNSADIVFGPVEIKGGSTRGKMLSGPRLTSAPILICDWIVGNFVPPCGVLWRRSFLTSICGWNESLKQNQDGELIIRGVLSGAKTASTDRGLSVYWSHISPDRISNTPTESKLRDAFEVIRDARHALLERGKGDDYTESAFSNATHRLHRLSCSHRFDDLSYVIGAYRHSAGWPLAVGSPLHIAATQLFGLRRKECFSRFLRNPSSLIK